MTIELKHGMADGTAEEFVLAAIHLGKECSNTKFIAPTMVCFAFAIELHIKAILASCDIAPGKLHNLLDLYMKLPEEKKDWIIRMDRNVAGESLREEFEKELERWSGSFVNIRYYHDRTEKNQAYFDFSNFIPNLAIAINNAYSHTEKYEQFCFPQLYQGS